MAVGRPPTSTLPCSLRPPASGRTRGRAKLAACVVNVVFYPKFVPKISRDTTMSAGDRVVCLTVNKGRASLNSEVPIWTAPVCIMLNS